MMGLGNDWNRVRSEEEKASESPWNAMAYPLIPKAESEGGVEVNAKSRWKQRLVANPGILTTAATEAIGQLRERESDNIPQRRILQHKVIRG